jgi:hypothetical protein
MSARLGKIERSLADRGRPVMWANEQEAALLSGVGPDKFRLKIRAWEQRGFPKVNSENGKRSIPAILVFWGLPLNHLTPMSMLETSEADDEDGQENWNTAG